MNATFINRKSMLALGFPGLIAYHGNVEPKSDATASLVDQYFNSTLVYKDITKAQIINGLTTINNSATSAIFSYLGHGDYDEINGSHLELVFDKLNATEIIDNFQLSKGLFNLKLMGLFACLSAYSGELVNACLDRGVDIVIGGTGYIPQVPGAYFLYEFYKLMLAGESIEKSYEKAFNISKIKLINEINAERERDITIIWILLGIFIVTSAVLLFVLTKGIDISGYMKAIVAGIGILWFISLGGMILGLIYQFQDKRIEFIKSFTRLGMILNHEKKKN
ncbi:MAG: hypothetical protein ACTSYB_00940 [Candidatus Helarchaeota archaeon]